MNITKNEMDITLSNLGCVERHVGHMKPLITNAIQIRTTKQSQAKRIWCQFGCCSNLRFNSRNESHSMLARMADKKRKEKIIRAIEGMAQKLLQIYEASTLKSVQTIAKLAKLIGLNTGIPRFK
jgi:hypothetical protein